MNEFMEEMIVDKSNQIAELMEINEKLEKALEKACNKLETLDSLISTNGNFEYREAEEWKEWCLSDE